MDVEEVVEDVNGRFVKLILNYNDTKCQFINVYCPNNEYERVCFINNMKTLIVDDVDVIIGGDFNCVLNNTLDRLNCRDKVDIGQIDIQHLMDQCDLEDVFRRRFPDKNVFSWRGRNKASRIDYWLISRSLDNMVNDVGYKIFPFSDHDAIHMSYRTTDLKYGKGLWKMNTSVIMSELFRNTFTAMWSEWKARKDDFSDIKLWWDMGKRQIRDLTIWCSKQIKKKEEEERKNLEQQIERFQIRVDEGENLERELSETTVLLQQHYNKKARGACIRSRVQWWDSGETSSSYFHNLEKRNGKDKLWDGILSKDGSLIRGTEFIMKRQLEFYKDLYQSQNIVIEDTNEFLQFDSTISEASKLLLEGPLELYEVKKSLDLMKCNKTPGPDGICIELYKLFWDLIGNDLLDVYENSFEEGELTYSQYLAVITLLYKKGNRQDIKNWRPISLQNVDVKILSKTLAERMKKVLPEIIHVDQQGCIPGRYIGKNIRLIEDVINEHDDDAVIVALDQEKAFDRVEWNWLFCVLEKFGFGQNFMKWLKTIYKTPKSAIITNGILSEYFDVTRGIRQGDALSALLYIIQSEPLAKAIRHNDKIEGITLIGYNNMKVETRCCQFVDDTIIFLKHVSMIDEVLDLVTRFGDVSGSKLNVHKTKGLVFNDNVLQRHTPIELTKGPEKILGVQMGKHINYDKFWKDKIEKLKAIFSAWNMRHLTLQGRIYLVKSLGLSSILYDVEMKDVNTNVVKQIINVIFNFVWKGKRHLVSKEVCCLPKCIGGMDMIDIPTVIKVKRIRWIIRLLEGNEAEHWKVLPLKYIRCLDSKYSIDFFSLKTTDASEAIHREKIPFFYKECLLHFQELLRKGNVYENMNQIVWCNTNLRFLEKPLAFKHWSQSGIQSITDILSPDGIIDENLICTKLVNKSGSYFELAKIRSSLPHKWKNDPPFDKPCVSNFDTSQILNVEVEIPGKKEKRCLSKLSSKDVYNILLNAKSVKVKSKQYWDGMYSDVTISWPIYFQINLCNKYIPRNIIDFNWKMFHGVNCTETVLQRMKLSDGKCVICQEKENVLHMLVQCIGLDIFWQKVESQLYRYLSKQFTLNVHDIMLGVCNKDDMGVIERCIVWALNKVSCSCS